MTQNRDNLKNAVLSEIETRAVCPRSRWSFLCQEYFVWTLWLLSAILGGLALAVCYFVITQQQYALYEATHDNALTFFIDALPYVWFVVLALMVVVAVYNIRHTKRGYRYPLWQIVGSSLVFSLIAGSALHAFGVGYAADNFLGKEIKMYMSYEKREQKLWQAPADGRLLGRKVVATVAPTTTVIFEDTLGQRWTVNISELHPYDRNVLNTMDKVRMIGTTTNTTTKAFHSCGVFPWMVGPHFDRSKLSGERRQFLERVYDHMHKAEERLALLEEKTFSQEDQRKAMGICANLAMVHRVEETLHRHE